MEAIKTELEAQGMNENEIKRYLANLKGDDAADITDDEEANGNTKTRVTKQEINADEIEFEMQQNNLDRTHIEYDENDMPLSNNTHSFNNN